MLLRPIWPHMVIRYLFSVRQIDECSMKYGSQLPGLKSNLCLCLIAAIYSFKCIKEHNVLLDPPSGILMTHSLRSAKEC